MTLALAVTQRSNRVVRLEWTSTDPDPALGYRIDREVNPPDTPKTMGTVSGAIRTFVDEITAATGFVVGDVIQYTVTDLDTVETGTASITWRDLDVPFTYGPVDPLVDVIRYTTLDLVKSRMGIEDNDRDQELTDAIIAAEIQIDQTLGRSLPDQGDNPEIPGIPQPIRTLALNASIASWKASESPFGSAGSDSLLGAIAVENTIEAALQRNPLLRGYQIAWGVA